MTPAGHILGQHVNVRHLGGLKKIIHQQIKNVSYSKEWTQNKEPLL